MTTNRGLRTFPEIARFYLEPVGEKFRYDLMGSKRMIEVFRELMTKRGMPDYLIDQMETVCEILKQRLWTNEKSVKSAMTS